MYLWVVIILMGVAPLVSIVAEMLMRPDTAQLLHLIGKWFVFWAVGIRLLTAGLRQIFNPEFTANDIFGMKDKSAEVLVQELGFANLVTGLLGTATLIFPPWLIPAAFAGLVFYAPAGIRHIMQPHRSRNETIAMLSDLWIAAILLLFLSWTAFR